ncbi:MAG: hypothetical protein RIQ94_2121 [Pseudomonadota bacterium]|jgi:hypothetical protein
MKSLPHFLMDAISKEFHFPHVKGDKNTLRLIEDQVPLASVDIKIKNSDNISCFSFDKKRQPKSGDAIFPFFNASEGGLCTKNDYILVCQKGNQVYVFLIELKSKNTGDYLKQLKAGKLFFQFIIDRIKLFNSDFQDLDKDNLHYKGILFRIDRTTPNKGTTKQRKLEFNKTPDLDVCILNYENFYHLSQFV